MGEEESEERSLGGLQLKVLNAFDLYLTSVTRFIFVVDTIRYRAIRMSSGGCTFAKLKGKLGFGPPSFI